MYDEYRIDGNTGSYHEVLNDGMDLEMEMVRRELRYGYKSRAYERFVKFRQRYYDVFEEVLLERGYMLCEVPNLFYREFKKWYDLNYRVKHNVKRVEVVNRFLNDFEV